MMAAITEETSDLAVVVAAGAQTLLAQVDVAAMAARLAVEPEAELLVWIPLPAAKAVMAPMGL